MIKLGVVLSDVPESKLRLDLLYPSVRIRRPKERRLDYDSAAATAAAALSLSSAMNEEMFTFELIKNNIVVGGPTNKRVISRMMYDYLPTNLSRYSF